MKQTKTKHAQLDRERKQTIPGFSFNHHNGLCAFGLNTCSSSLSLSSLSLSLSDVSDCSSTLLDNNLSLALSKLIQHQRLKSFNLEIDDARPVRCPWITKNSDQLYVDFHDKCWGVPVYEDDKLFELLVLSGMQMDFNWTEILKMKPALRDVFFGFEPAKVAKMTEKDVANIASNDSIMLQENRVRCIIDNAKCIVKVANEVGSFSYYIWGMVNHKPIINKHKLQKSVPIRSTKAEHISKELIKRGFRLVGPVIVYSFMQVAGLTIDHLVDCFRYDECVGMAESPE